jgi:hypothetical protein
MMKNVVVRMVQILRKFVMMDVVIIDVPPTYGIRLSNIWGLLLGIVSNLTYLLLLYLSLEVRFDAYIESLKWLLSVEVSMLVRWIGHRPTIKVVESVTLKQLPSLWGEADPPWVKLWRERDWRTKKLQCIDPRRELILEGVDSIARKGIGQATSSCPINQ